MDLIHHLHRRLNAIERSEPGDYAKDSTACLRHPVMVFDEWKPRGPKTGGSHTGTKVTTFIL